jgi:hypothetical protein
VLAKGVLAALAPTGMSVSYPEERLDEHAPATYPSTAEGRTDCGAGASAAGFETDPAVISPDGGDRRGQPSRDVPLPRQRNVERSNAEVAGLTTPSRAKRDRISNWGSLQCQYR